MHIQNKSDTDTYKHDEPYECKKETYICFFRQKTPYICIRGATKIRPSQLFTDYGPIYSRQSDIIIAIKVISIKLPFFNKNGKLV